MKKKNNRNNITTGYSYKTGRQKNCVSLFFADGLISEVAGNIILQSVLLSLRVSLVLTTLSNNTCHFTLWCKFTKSMAFILGRSLQRTHDGDIAIIASVALK